MQDILLQKLFEPERWLSAISKGYDKDIRKDQLIRLTSPSVRASIYRAMKEGTYTIAPPHAALIPKDTPGEFRRVFVNEPIDRVLLSIVNDLLFDTCRDMVHPRCKSYIKGTGCGNTVRELSREIARYHEETAGWKADLSKYFDSVPLRFIEAVFDAVEERTGPSAVLDMLRRYYRSDLYFDEEGVPVHGFQSLKQGCAVAAFLADTVLRHVDERLSRLDGYYVRYSDDMLFVGKDHAKAMEILVEELTAMDMKLNPAKVEDVRKDRWFKFLGFAVKGSDISLCPKRIKKFEKTIRSMTVDAAAGTTVKEAVNNTVRFLYKGDGEHSWASQVLSVCNVRKDIDTLNAFAMDCIRAVATGRKKVGGLGFSTTLPEGCIARGTGANVTANKKKTPKEIPGFLTLGCMRNALLASREAYGTLTRTL